jgi:CheY-like chemotaxis protein
MTLAEATILLVDDEPELLEIFAIWLRRCGSTVLTAENGAEAFKILEARPVDALISDIRMPIMDGLTLVRRIYESKLLVPSIIFVSGFGDVDAREIYSLGVEAMLAKPLVRQQLLDALECSLLPREKLWLTLPEEAAAQSVSLEMLSLEEAMERHGFAIGRGGCCFLCPQPLTEERTVDLLIQFVKEGLCLKAQGTVRWYHSSDSHAGVAFTYLDAASRPWVLQYMNSKTLYSFIPRCQQPAVP